MKPQARIQASIDVLEKVLENTRVPMDTVVGDYMRHRRYIGSKDRAAVAERVYEMMRSHARLGWWLENAGVEDTPRNRVLTYLVLAEGADEKRLKDLFDSSKYSPKALTPTEWNYVKSIKEEGEASGQEGLAHKKMPESTDAECPSLYEDKLRAYFGADFTTEMQAMLEPATLDLRVNTFLASREKVKDYLEADGVKTTETPYSPWGLRCAKKAYLSKTKAMAKGWIEIQDEGSQLIALMCAVQPGMQVLDYCAGAGGKTLALAAAMERKGRIVAMDTEERRLEKGKQRYKKAKLSDIIEVRALGDDKQRKWLKRQKEKFDVVLTDVPCTGTGTWRRNPDMRWTTYGPSLEELTEIQVEILEKAAPCVKPGGRLVYATCSLLPDENEDQIEAFLKRHPDFEVQPISNVIPSVVEGSGQLSIGSDSSIPLRSSRNDNKGSFLRLTPHRHNTDGFFAAILKKAEN